jgi:hypothetical protein
MFCPKCGGQNPDEGKFCRSCGAPLANVTEALSKPQQLLDHKGRPIHLEGAMKKLFSGFAFLVIAIALSLSKVGDGWWFWMLIPAFGAIGTGLAQYMQIRRADKSPQPLYPGPAQELPSSPSANAPLPPAQTEWVAPDSKYKTGDLVPPSVTENTTRHLEIEDEPKTMALPKD